MQLTIFSNSESTTLGVEAVHGTFQGGSSEPGHLWFPYLEGYSPEFVRQIVNRFMPHAALILEPFAGTGTTPFTVCASGVGCAYSEVNPILRSVTDLKLQVLQAPPGLRRELAEHTRHLSRSMISLSSSALPAPDLTSSYESAFGRSQFFDPDQFERVVRLRSVCDDLYTNDRLLGQILEVAVMANLVACSRLKRAGDLRYRRPKELARGAPALDKAVADQLKLMADDMDRFPRSDTQPRYVCGNAKDLVRFPSLNADGLITSPPYLNGTNYIRNTRLELWFTRHVVASRDLRTLRDQVVTAGINDVGPDTGRRTENTRVADLVERMAETAYDGRIPRMVAGYFNDMSAVLEGIAHQLRPGAIACIDIGDSRYAGVHVPTQSLLADIAEVHGLQLRDIVNLRKRVSKDQGELSQDLLVFENTGPSTARRPHLPTVRAARWLEFKERLPHQRFPFDRRNWGNPLHSICSYAGKMKPALAHHLVRAFTQRGQTVLDPFSGSGTIPFEAALLGRRAFAADIGTLPSVVSNAKLQPVRATDAYSRLEDLASWLDTYEVRADQVQSAAEVSFNKSIVEYYHAATLKEIIAAREFFRCTRDSSPTWNLLFACMLHVLHGNRPYALSRRSHPLTPYAPSGPTEYKSVMSKLTAKVERSLRSSRSDIWAGGVCHQLDVVRDPWPAEWRRIDAVITSPPFFDSTRFYMTNWLRYWFAGWERRDFDEEPTKYVEQEQKRGFTVYGRVLKRLRSRLSAKGIVALHLGLSRKCDMAAEIADVVPPGYEVLDRFVEGVAHCDRHGIRDKGTVTAHQYLILCRT